MKLLLDEDVPLQLLEPLRRLLPEHQVDHVGSVGWKGKKDRFLLSDAARKDYAAFLTNDSRQLESPDESRAIRDAGIHHIRYRHDSRRGIDGLALAMGSVMAGIRPVMAELDGAEGQRLVAIRAIAPEKRPRSWTRALTHRATGRAGLVRRPRGVNLAPKPTCGRRPCER